MLRDRAWRGFGLAWSSDKTLRKVLVRAFTKFHELHISGGPLRYGLMPAGNGWDWGLVVTTKNSERVRLDPQEMLRDADAGADRLPEAWLRHSDRPDVLERRVPLDALPKNEILLWFETGLRQLREAKILDRYAAGLAAKQAGTAAQSECATATPQVDSLDTSTLKTSPVPTVNPLGKPA
jgi:hypothetical protein